MQELTVQALHFCDNQAAVNSHTVRVYKGACQRGMRRRNTSTSATFDKPDDEDAAAQCRHHRGVTK